MRKDETEDRVDENGIGNPLVSIHENRRDCALKNNRN
jgi:hypothetical protein